MTQTSSTNELSKIIANYYKCLTKVLLEEGVNINPYLKQEGLDRATAFSAEHPHTLEQYYRVVKRVVAGSKIDGVGLKFGQQTKLTDYGILGFALLGCANLVETAKLASKFISMTSNLLEMDQRIEKSAAIVSFRELQPLFWSQPFLIEECISETMAIRKALLPELEGHHPIKINLTYAKPSYAKLYDDIFQCPISFNQPKNELWLPASWLELPISTANEVASEVCAQQCELITSHLSNQGDMVDRVRRTLLSHSMISILRLEEMAEELHLSPRTLRKRLYDSGTSYKEIVNEIRVQTAMEYLSGSNLSVQEVAYLIGYEHSPNFFRAFKKSVGVTPEQYRLQTAS
jgi:AraC-like DNA-binding protein